MSTYLLGRGGRGVRICALALLWIALGGGGQRIAASGEAGGPATVVIDPGHGGGDTGTVGAQGAFEKDVALALARLVAARLANSCTVVLTRTDDYALSLFRRQELAGQGDVLVSIHAGGAGRPSIGSRCLYYHGAFPDGPTGAIGDGVSLGALHSPVEWSRRQFQHGAASRRLAETLQSALAIMQAPLAVTVRKAPLVLLSGVDMPAVLFEAGLLTRPPEEKELTDPARLAQLAGAIATGIEAYLGRHSGIGAMDLHR